MYGIRAIKEGVVGDLAAGWSRASDTGYRVLALSPNLSPGLVLVHGLLLQQIFAGIRLTDLQVSLIESSVVPRKFNKAQFYKRAGEVTTQGGFVVRRLFSNPSMKSCAAPRIFPLADFDNSTRQGWL